LEGEYGPGGKPAVMGLGGQSGRNGKKPY